jgi:hypothetical protein
LAFRLKVPDTFEIIYVFVIYNTIGNGATDKGFLFEDLSVHGREFVTYPLGKVAMLHVELYSRNQDSINDVESMFFRESLFPDS